MDIKKYLEEKILGKKIHYIHDINESLYAVLDSGTMIKIYDKAKNGKK